MHDREIVAAIVAGDPAGLSAAWNQYAPALHSYCRSLLAEPSDAADAVQDTFVVAASKLAGLREPDRLRPWLYAVARNECHRRLRSRARMADLDEAGEMTDASTDVGLSAERAELRDLVRAAIAGLNPGEQEIIELSLQHELDGAELAGVLGVAVNQAHALASRARGQLERSLGALIVARRGRKDCPELSELLAGWDGQLTVLLRKRVSRHIEHCDVCGQRKRRELSPAMLLSVLPVVFLPSGLRDEVFRLVADPSPEAARYREHVAKRAEPFGSSGFPVPVASVARVRLRGQAIAFAAFAALLLIVVGGVAAAGMLRHGGGGGGTANAAAHGAATLGASPGASASSTPTGPARSPDAKHAKAPASASPSAAPSLASHARPTSSVSPTAPPSPVRTSKPTPTPSPTSSPSPTPTPGTLSESPATIRLPDLGSSATFTLTADGGPVSFTITGPAGVSVSPASGKLAAGKTVTVTVTAVGNGPPKFVNTLTVNPGGLTVTVDYAPEG
jgi:RNA polymerase sigma factor (sigma-70 family)